MFQSWEQQEDPAQSFFIEKRNWARHKACKKKKKNRKNMVKTKKDRIYWTMCVTFGLSISLSTYESWSNQKKNKIKKGGFES